MIIDIHTHHPAPQPEGIVNIAPDDSCALEGQLYSVGIHPWNSLAAISPEQLETLEKACARPQVVAVGECGVDTLKGGPMFRQLQVFKAQIEISERLGKPLIVHDVKAHDIIVGLRRDLQPKQPWVVHGFRGKPQVAAMLLQAGCWLSFGEKFNAETLKAVAADRLLAETDDSPLSISDIISSLSAAAGHDLLATIQDNTARFLGA